MRQFPSTVAKKPEPGKQIDGSKKPEPIKQIKCIVQQSESTKTPQNSPTIDRNSPQNRSTSATVDLTNLRNRFVKIGEDAKKINQHGKADGTSTNSTPKFDPTKILISLPPRPCNKKIILHGPPGTIETDDPK